jgi:hypothetical protein
MPTAVASKKKPSMPRPGKRVQPNKPVHAIHPGHPRTTTSGKKTGSFDKFKEYNGKLYTGVQIGRGHHWRYDEGDWKETKITPDLWEISYAVTKRRVGHAPENSGVQVGTEYHWYILAHQNAKKLNADNYETTMTGLKFKLAHKRADNGKWSASGPTQRKYLVAFLKQFLRQLEKDPVTFEFAYQDKTYKGEAVPVSQTCANGVCFELDVSLNNEELGIIRYGRSGWKMDLVKDQKLVDAIGQKILQWFE